MAAEIEKRHGAHTRGNEIIAVVLTALAVLIFLSLVTYSAGDPSINTSSSQKTQNWVGVFGSNIADVLFNSVGISAYFLPPLLFLVAWRSFKAENLSLSLGRAAGYFLFIVSFSSLAALLSLNGGLVGVFFSRLLASLLGGVGAGILLAMFLVLSVLTITNFSFASFFGSFALAAENLRLRFDEWFSKYKTKKASDKTSSAQTDKRAEAKPEKNETKKTPFSDDDTDEAADEEKSWLGERISSVWNRLTKAVKAELPAKSEKQEASKPEAAEVKEAQVPIISAFQGAPKEKEAEKQSDIEIEKTREIEKPNPFSDDEFDAPVTFSPVRETGELDRETFVEAAQTDEANESGEPDETVKIEETETLPDLPAKPQNFDDYVLPRPEFLNPAPPRVVVKEDEARALAKELEEKTREFNATGKVVNICPGPVVTTYEFKPDPGVKYSRITGLSDDLCLALKAESIRIDRIPGKAFVGIEVPNRERDTIYLREVVESVKFRESKSLLTLALGKTIDGLNYVADLAKMPHLLIAGATGAGKSVGVNTLVVSILYKAKPDEVKFIMVDPKRLELGLYADIPHLATPIITDPKRAAISLKWAVSEMEKRYKELAGWGVRNIDGYNAEVKKRNALEHFDDNGEAWKTLPYIVIIIDELADLMMVSGKEVEESITRLAQMARAVGIHLVLATQRPSVDVITGLIKANFPARISFRVSSKVDSRTILDSNGSEQLLGKGDMLFLPPASSQLTRVHGAYVDEKEIHQIVEHIKKQGNPEYDATITKTEDELVDTGELPGRKDALFVDALKTVVGSKRASTSLLQRHLRIGYGRAAAILDAMVHEGYIGEMDGSSRARPILQKAYDDLQELEEGREL